MRAFFITFIIVIIVAAGTAYWLWLNADRMPEGTILKQAGQAMHTEQPEPPARAPEDYHILQTLGGIPLSEATRGGLVSADYAYLQAIEPIQISEGVEPIEGARVAGLSYDLGFQFVTRPPAEQYLEFNINGKWDELHLGFGFDDSHPSDPEDKWAIELTILGDGKELLEPTTLKPTMKPMFTSLNVSGVNRLAFVIRRVGKRNPFTPLLLDPFLKKTQPEPSE